MYLITFEALKQTYDLFFKLFPDYNYYHNRGTYLLIDESRILL